MTVWTDEIITELRLLWIQGHSTAEIGRRLGVSKNAVVGKAHRIDLDARPSPIIRSADKPPKSPKSTLPPLPSMLAKTSEGRRYLGPDDKEKIIDLDSKGYAPMQIAQTLSLTQRLVVRVIDARRRALTPPPTPPKLAVKPVFVEPKKTVVQMPRRAGLPCCWPEGTPGTRDFRFCDGPTEAGKPYCTAHSKRAYVRVQPREEVGAEAL